MLYRKEDMVNASLLTLKMNKGILHKKIIDSQVLIILNFKNNFNRKLSQREIRNNTINSEFTRTALRHFEYIVSNDKGIWWLTKKGENVGIFSREESSKLIKDYNEDKNKSQ